MTLYALEGLLTRLATTKHRDTFVLKGGLLLAALDVRRPTRDIDMQALDFDNDVDHVVAVVRDMIAVELDDGVRYDPDSVSAVQIREDDDYHGVRVAVDATLATAKLKLKFDINVGDPITPDPITVDVPRILNDEPITMLGVPVTMQLAEKIVTAVQRGTTNTRWRDFTDVALIAQQHDIDGDDLALSVQAVAGHRGANLRPLAEVLEGFADQAQGRWRTWVRKWQLDDRVPEHFGEVLERVQTFADPVLNDEVGGHRWQAAAQVWQPR